MEIVAVNKIKHLVVWCLSWFCISEQELSAQQTYKVLFLGNSYTYVNDLPQMIHDAALSAGDTLIFDSYAPGGYQLQDHSTDVNSQAKIMAGGWHYVVIQGQSQEPVMLSSQFTNGGLALQNKIRQYNPCAVTMPYMTWGRKNGDAANCQSYPLMCTYRLMDSTIRSRYVSLTDVIDGEVSPVSVVWRYLRQNHPGIELYAADESHPSLAGTYAAACCFYAALFKKDPALISFNPGLSAGDAAAIRNAAKSQVFAQLSLWDFKKLPRSAFSYQIGAGTNQVIFTPNNFGASQSYVWDFGDGTGSSASNPMHSYAANGTYTVSLTTANCDLQGWHSSVTDTVIRFCSHTPAISASHAWLCQYDTLWTQPADTYQWYLNGIQLPETNRFLADYARYGIYGFTVISTLGGCAELSRLYTQTAETSGYYFDAIGDPCQGDTVAFAVLHVSASLPGTESIFWFKNGALLPWMTGQDTLLISTPGTYKCQVVNPGSHCPLDTTRAEVSYDCGLTGMKERAPALFWSVFPNPASESITVKFGEIPVQENIQVYNTLGELVRSVTASPVMKLPVADLPAGLYYLSLKSNRQAALKFMKQ